MHIAYIDAQNIHKSLQGLGWIIDREKFYCYLKNRYSIQEVIIFFGYIPQYKRLYHFLERVGYTLIFKEVSQRLDGTTKGNVDIDIAIQAMKDIMKERLQKAYLITTDSDFNTLIYEFRNRNLWGRLFVASFDNTSKYLRRASGDLIQPLTDIKHLIEFVK